MATVKHSSSAPPAPGASQSNGGQQAFGAKRQPFFRSISRLWNNTNKARPKLAPRTADTQSTYTDAVSIDSGHPANIPLAIPSASLEDRNAFYSVRTDENGQRDTGRPTSSYVEANSSRRSMTSASMDDGREEDESVISQRSAGADTDASMRVFAPSSIADSTASRSDSASQTTHQTFKSYASTKPTTLLSVDSQGANLPQRMPIASTSSTSNSPVVNGMPRSQSSTTGGITFSSLPPTLAGAHPSADVGSLAQAPKHTPGNARSHPNMSAPPPDNASTLTLASSHFTPSVYPRVSGLRKPDIADEDASLRVLPGSRRNSEESLGAKSTWSAANALMRGNASIRTSGSIPASSQGALASSAGPTSLATALASVSSQGGASSASIRDDAASLVSHQTSLEGEARHAPFAESQSQARSGASITSRAGETEAQQVVRATHDRQRQRETSQLSREVEADSRPQTARADSAIDSPSPSSPTTPTELDKPNPLSTAVSAS